MLTARSNIDARVEGYAHGADVYLPKPVDPEELLAVIGSLGRRVDTETTDVQKPKIDTDRLLLIGAGSEQALTQRECRLLIALARANDRMLEHWQVLELLDPEEKGLSTESVAMCIGQLRKKLIATSGSAPAGASMIKAVRGSGYRLLVPLEIL